MVPHATPAATAEKSGPELLRDVLERQNALQQNPPPGWNKRVQEEMKAIGHPVGESQVYAVRKKIVDEMARPARGAGSNRSGSGRSGGGRTGGNRTGGGKGGSSANGSPRSRQERPIEVRPIVNTQPGPGAEHSPETLEDLADMGVSLRDVTLLNTLAFKLGRNLNEKAGWREQDTVAELDLGYVAIHGIIRFLRTANG